MKKLIPIHKLKKKRWYTLNQESTIFNSNHPHADEYREIKRTSHKRKFQFIRKDANKTDDATYPYYVFLEWDPLTNKTQQFIVWFDFIHEFLFNETTVPANIKHTLKALKRVNKKIRKRTKKNISLKNLTKYNLSTLDEKNIRKNPIYKHFLKPLKLGGSKKSSSKTRKIHSKHSNSYSNLAKKTMLKMAKKTHKIYMRQKINNEINKNLKMSPAELIKQRPVIVRSNTKITPSIYRKKIRV